MIDHRRLGRDLGLFHSDPLVGAGLPIWLPAGAASRHAVEEYVRELERLAGYQHVYSPPLARREMYRRSGHLAKFADDMFPPMLDDRAPRSDEEDPAGDGEPREAMMLRPSLCPHHAVVYASRLRSYRELPVRIAELGGMYRAERSGVLGGLSRVRAISLNDGHVFCAPDQVGAEVARNLELSAQALAALGVAVDGYRLSLRGGSGSFLGDAAVWDDAEQMLRDALDRAGLPYAEAAGEAAFYGPKIDVQVRDHLGREFTLATVQVDHAQPERFDLSYVDADGARRRPVMVHRSLVGGMERLFAHLIEVHGGAFPAWYAPVQLVVVPLGDGEPADHAHRLADAALRRGLRAEVAAAGSLGRRVREAAHRKVPYLAVVGGREVADGSVSLRLRDGRTAGPAPAEAMLDLIDSVVSRRSADLLP